MLCSNLSFSIGTSDQSVSLYFLCITSYLTCTFLQIARDHSFPRNADFRAKLRNLPVSVEFLCFHEFCGIQYWQVLGVQAAIHDFTMKCHDCHSGCNGRNTENIELSLSEILPFNLADRLYLPVAVTGDKYCTFGWVQRSQKISCYMWKICHGKLWSLQIAMKPG